MYSFMSELSVLNVLKSAFLVKLPDLQGIKNGDVVAPIATSIAWIAPFQLALCKSMSQFVKLGSPTSSELVCNTNNEFEIIFNEEEVIDSTMLMYLAVEAAEHIIHECSIRNNVLDMATISKAFVPSLFGLEQGELLDCSKLQDGIMVYMLSDTGLISPQNAIDIMKGQSFDSPFEMTKGITL